MSDEERFYLLLDAYLAGDARSADVRIVREWLAADPRRAQVLEDIRRIREVARAGKKHRSAEEAWRRLLPTLLAELPGAPPAPGRLGKRRRFADLPRSRAWLRAHWRVAAAIVIVAVGLSSVVTTMVTGRRDLAQGSITSERVRSFATDRGEREDIRLADGSRVMLAPQSRLVVLSTTGGAREVRLEGEAYFDVVHDDRQPFTVHAHNAIVRDVGTRFAVRAYAVDSLVRVVVTHGQVNVRGDTTKDRVGTLLDPRMVARVNAAGHIAVERGADTSRYVAFRKGQIVFVGSPLRDVVHELERWYDIEISLADPTMGDRRITATIADQTLGDLLDQLRIALNVRVARTDRRVVLSDKARP
jgi:transmembrane sensor